MRLKIAQTNACQEALIRGGFKTTDRYSTMVELRLGGDKPGEVVYDVLFPRDGFRGDWFVTLYKGTAGPASKGWFVWDISNTIKFRLA